MNQELSKEQEIQKEIQKRKKEQERQLIIKAHQIRAVCMSGDTEFFKIGKEECDLLKKFFPDEADKLLAEAMKDKFEKAESKEKKNPGSVNRTSLLEELEGLCGKAFKQMLENMKSRDKGKENDNQASGLSDAENNISNNKQMSEVENVKEQEKVKEAPQKAQEMQEQVTINNKLKGKQSFFEKMQERANDGYKEGSTGKRESKEITVVEETTTIKTSMNKKEEKKLAKEQKKLEKQQRKEEKAARKQKVAPISKDALNEARGAGNAKSADDLQREQYEKAKLEAYNKKLQDRVAANAKQRANSNVREMSGPVRKKP